MESGKSAGLQSTLRGMSALQQWQPRSIILTASALHFILAFVYRYSGVISMTIDPKRNTWDWFFQLAPMNLLITRPVETIVYFHAQPPLYNILGSILGRLFYPYHLDALYTFNILLGTLMVTMLGGIVFHLTQARVVTAAAAFCIALYPSLFVYEAYILYTHLSAFLVVSAIFWMTVYTRDHRGKYLFLFFLTLNLLVLTRSLFHPLFLIAAIVIVTVLVQAHRWRVLRTALLISLLTVIVVLKNYFLFGFFGLSSWSGLNLYRIAILPYATHFAAQTPEELVADGVIDRMVVDVPAFSVPSAYRSFGFTETSDIPVLNGNDRNNINYIAVSNVYLKNALALIRWRPANYLKAVGAAYLVFSQSSARFKHTVYNAERMGLHELIYDRLLYTEIRVSQFRIPILAPILPLTILAYLVFAWRRCRWSLSRWVEFARQDMVMVMLLLFISYVIVVSCMLEYSENARFKYLIELPALVFVLVNACRAWTARRGRAKSHSMP